jgi:hypothetical protein
MFMGLLASDVRLSWFVEELVYQKLTGRQLIVNFR